jgi:hypothetical protein
MKVLYHLGLGDAIATAAIIAKLAKENDIVEIPCWEHNDVSVTSLFVDFPNVIVKLFSSETDLLAWGQDADLKLGHYGESPKLPQEDFVQWFYRQANFNLLHKNQHCPINNRISLSHYEEIPDYLLRAEIVLYHDDNNRGFIIPRKSHGQSLVVSVSKTEGTVLVWTDLLQQAAEIHCIDSALIHLVECTHTKAKLHYHKYARPNSPDYKYLQKKWEVIE